MAGEPMSNAEMHDAIVHLHAEVYTLNLMTGRLYMALAHLQPDPQKFIDEALSVILRDVDHFRLEPNYSPEAATAQRERMRNRARELFGAMIPADAKLGRH